MTIDDRLPCINSSLCFSRCHSPTAFWVALLEKAYAKSVDSLRLTCIFQTRPNHEEKFETPFPFPFIFCRLRGSYERLWAGQVSEALVDLTGGLAERWSLGDFGSEEEQQTAQDSDQVRKRRLDLNLLDPVKDDCVLSCSTHSTPGGQKSVCSQIIQ